MQYYNRARSGQRENRGHCKNPRTQSAGGRRDVDKMNKRGKRKENQVNMLHLSLCVAENSLGSPNHPKKVVLGQLFEEQGKDEENTQD